MNAVELLVRKRDAQTLTASEIHWLIEAFTKGSLPDYQMAAFAMAVYLRGMDAEETAALTHAMLHSGRILQWSPGPTVVDKHSTGGVGDKVSLILAPLLASQGLRVPKLAGRGLGPTGGTLDKLDSIPGFRTDLPLASIQRQVDTIGCVITGATPDIAPADRKLYALRDVTATVASVALITASIMSKKLAEGLQHLVLDVKYGSGAFMKSLAGARQLAESLIRTGVAAGVGTTAVVSNMDQPLGVMVGNAVEVDEACMVLQGDGPADVRELTLTLGAQLLVAANIADETSQAHARLARGLDSGEAWERWVAMVQAQGGDPAADRPRAEEHRFLAERSGYLTAIDTEALGWAVIELGGGRTAAGQSIDHGVGLQMHCRLGQRVDHGQQLVTIFARQDPRRVRHRLRQALHLEPVPKAIPPLVAEILC